MTEAELAIALRTGFRAYLASNLQPTTQAVVRVLQTLSPVSIYDGITDVVVAGAIKAKLINSQIDYAVRFVDAMLDEQANGADVSLFRKILGPDPTVVSLTMQVNTGGIVLATLTPDHMDEDGRLVDLPLTLVATPRIIRFRLTGGVLVPGDVIRLVVGAATYNYTVTAGDANLGDVAAGVVLLAAADPLFSVTNTTAALRGLTLAQASAIKSYVASSMSGALDFIGMIDGSASPLYPAAVKGAYYVVSVSGKIGGAAGVAVVVGDALVAIADNIGGTQAAVGASWALLPYSAASQPLHANLTTLANTLGAFGAAVAATTTAAGFVGELASTVHVVVAQAYNVISTDVYVMLDASAGAQTITLPADPGPRKLYFKRIDSSVNSCTLVTAAQIDGLVSLGMDLQWQAITLVRLDADWFVF